MEKRILNFITFHPIYFGFVTNIRIADKMAGKVWLIEKVQQSGHLFIPEIVKDVTIDISLNYTQMYNPTNSL